MKKQNILQKFMMFSLLLFSCGGGDDSVVKNITYAVSEEYISLDVEFDDSLEFDLEAVIPIKDYGNLKLIPAGRKKGFIIGFDLDLSIIDDEDIKRVGKTRYLPNGQPMSRYVDEPLLWVRFKESGNIRPSLYLGTSFENFYLGSAIEIESLGEKFPGGITLSVRLKDQKKRAIGVITLYGPKLDDNGKVKVPGGVFFATNLTDLIQYAKDDKESENEGKGTRKVYVDGDFVVKKDGDILDYSRRKTRRLVKKFIKAMENRKD